MDFNQKETTKYYASHVEFEHFNHICDLLRSLDILSAYHLFYKY